MRGDDETNSAVDSGQLCSVWQLTLRFPYKAANLLSDIPPIELLVEERWYTYWKSSVIPNGEEKRRGKLEKSVGGH